MEDFENRINQAMTIENEDERLKKIKEIMTDMIEFFKDSKPYEKIKKICNMNLDYKQKLQFFMEAHSCKEVQHFFRTELLPYCFILSVQEQEGLNVNIKEEFFELLKNDIEFQKKYAKYFKQEHYKDYIIQGYLNELFKLPIFKQEVLTDEDFFAKKVSKNYDFFDILPKEYGYLVSLYETKNIEIIKELYNLYFKDSLNEEQQLEFAELQLNIDNSTNIFRIDNKERKAKLTFILKSILEDEQFLKNMKAIQNKTELDLKSMISFVYKYHDTELYKSLINGNIDSAMKDKIEYLSKEEKIKDIDKRFPDINNTKIEELMDAPKEIKTGIKPNLQGGPQSKETDLIFFEDSESAREFRIIYKDGKQQKVKLDLYNDNHIIILSDIFKGKIKNMDDNFSALELALQAADEIGAITYMIEHEQCTIILPEDISIEQKKESVKLLKKGSPLGKIGIYVFYRNLKEQSEDKGNNPLEYSAPLNDGDIMGRRQAAEEILKLGEKVTKEELNLMLSEISNKTNEDKGR